MKKMFIVENLIKLFKKNMMPFKNVSTLQRCVEKGEEKQYVGTRDNRRENVLLE